MKKQKYSSGKIVNLLPLNNRDKFIIKKKYAGQEHTKDEWKKLLNN